MKVSTLFNRLFISLLATAVFYLAAAAQKPANLAQKNTVANSAEAIAQSGSLEGKLYTNKALGFSYLVPGGWQFFSNEENEAALRIGRENVKTGVSAEADANLDQSIANTQILFQATPRFFGDPGNTAVLSSGVEKLASFKTTEKYLEVNKRLVLHTPGVKLARDAYTIAFGGVSFMGFEVEGTTGQKSYRQQYLATVRGNVAVFIVITCYDHRYDNILAESLKTIRFAK